MQQSLILDRPSASMLPKSFVLEMVAPETQKPEEPDSVQSEKCEEGTHKSSSNTAYYSCKELSSNEQKSAAKVGSD
jgi:hypothetical protein